MLYEGPYKLQYDGYELYVTEAIIEGTRVFHVEFSNHIKAVNLIVVDNGKGFKFWTTVPQGRQAIADEIGPVIGRYYYDKKKK
jgi:hypothetical protein